MKFAEKTINKNIVYNGKILNLRVDDVVLCNGQNGKREIVEHNGGSAILCLENDKVLLVKQFRYAYKEFLWEIPAGKINNGENPDETAIRELEEECGYKAGKIVKLLNMYPSPGYTNEVIRIYQAFDLIKTHTNFDDDEDIESKWFNKKEIKEMIESGEIKDAKTLVALLKII